VYRGIMAHALPSGIPFPAAEAARSTLGGALAEAGRLPGSAGAELLGSAREAFVQALETAAAISAGVALATAILVVVLLRGVRASSERVQSEVEVSRATHPASSRA
jgi:DHA2 family multidrug resistance protein-like MFS transporter